MYSYVIKGYAVLVEFENNIFLLILFISIFYLFIVDPSENPSAIFFAPDYNTAQIDREIFEERSFSTNNADYIPSRTLNKF